MNSKFAFYAGVFISLKSFPFSIPYLITLGKYATLHMGVPSVAGYLIIYNIGYALPMLVVLAIYLIVLRSTADYSGILHGKAKSLNLHLNTLTFVLFGVFSMTDAAIFFTTGHALLKGRYFKFNWRLTHF
jgi:cytochrome c biogenesis protein CcdA